MELTKREQMAILILNGYLSEGMPTTEAISMAVEAADELLQELTDTERKPN